MDDDQGSHLSVVVDFSPVQWYLAAQADPYPLSLRTFFPQLLAFLNAHIASKHENTLAVFGAFPGKSILLYSSIDTVPSMLPIDANSYPPFKFVDSTVVHRVMEELNALSESEELEPAALVSALTKALCYVNRVILSSGRTAPATNKTADQTESAGISLSPRILILSVSPDLTASYVPVMNSIFSAQKLKVTIDACQIFGPDTVFLQQAAHLTNGSYIYLERRDALMQYMIMSFLPSPPIRQVMSVPTQDKIDFRATCFCHKNIIDIGFICSVCLSIYCQPVPVCTTCRTKFPIKTLQRLMAARRTQNEGISKPNTRVSSPASTPRSEARVPSALPSSNNIGVNGHQNNGR